MLEPRQRCNRGSAVVGLLIFVTEFRQVIHYHYSKFPDEAVTKLQSVAIFCGAPCTNTCSLAVNQRHYDVKHASSCVTAHGRVAAAVRLSQMFAPPRQRP